MSAYYNEIDGYAANWLRNLIAAGLICPGDVDERSIEDVHPDDIRGYTQCHFFAGIGVWSHSLRQAGWSDDRPVWTGSCPCQPFSAAGKGNGFADERHLWPAFFHLIRACGPVAIFGEQVASPDGLAWLDLVQTDLEAENYTPWAADICAAGIGAPHIRQRLYWLAYADSRERDGLSIIRRPKPHRKDVRRSEGGREFEPCIPIGGLADTNGTNARTEREQCGGELRQLQEDGGPLHRQRPGPSNGFWRNADWLGCRDGKWRPVEPGTFPLAHGASARLGRLRAYGNALNAEQAKAFIAATKEVMP